MRRLTPQLVEQEQLGAAGIAVDKLDWVFFLDDLWGRASNLNLS